MPDRIAHLVQEDDRRRNLCDDEPFAFPTGDGEVRACQECIRLALTLDDDPPESDTDDGADHPTLSDDFRTTDG